jgi:hypothetical protein
LKLLQITIFSTFSILLALLADNKVFAAPAGFFQTLPQQTDSVKRDSLNSVRQDTTKKPLKRSGLDSKLEYYAKDSTVTDKQNEIMYLYGGARVKYQGFELDADFIRFDNKNKVIFARGSTNDKGKYLGRPIFKMEAQGSSMADSLSYNTETGKGIVSGVFTEQEGGFFSGGKTKMQPDNEFHVSGTTFSTCNLPHPHFGIHITKGIATEKHIITGPVYMKFEDIPMPLGLPFAFFPKPNKKASGFILPTPAEDATKGFSLLGGGYYLAFNDYMDARLIGNIFTNGSYDLNLVSNYTKRYKYNGNINLSYSSTRNGLEGTPEYTPQKNFLIGWTHSQGANARPGTTFSASVTAGTGSYLSVTAANGTYDPTQILRNTMSSSVSYGRVFGDGLFNFTSALTHSQETQSKTISLTLPQVSLNMSTISPFDSKKRIGEQKWYQRLTVGYSMNANNTVNTTEDLLFAPGGFNRFTNSVEHTIPISLPFTLFKYLNFSSNVNYNEKWDFKTIRNRYIRTATGNEVRTDTVNGFRRGGQYSLGTSMSTKIYGIKQFRGNGAIRAMRHIVTPNISFTYRPDFSKDSYGYYLYQQYYTNDIRPGMSVPTGEFVLDNMGNPLKYSIFPNGGPSAGEQASIGFSVDNNVELKIRNRKDTTGTGERKLAIIQGLTFSSAYNFVALQKKLSPVNFSGRSQFTEKLGINFSGQFSPYQVEQVAYTTGTGADQITSYSYQEVDKYVWNNGKLPRLTNFTFSFDYSLNPEAFKKRNENIDNVNNQTASSSRTQDQIDALNAVSRDPNAFVDFNIPWNFSFSYSFNYSNPLGRPETRSLTNTLNFSGDFNLTPKWKIQYTSGYDFRAKNLSQTSFSIYRDLHCWDLSASWIPFGAYQSYSIDIRVRASVLQDLKLSKRKGYYTRY